MAIPFTVKQTEKLLSFIGYGNTKAPFWFIGMEEGGGGETNLKARLEFEPIEDLKNAHDILGITKHHYPPYKLQPTWRTMCAIMLTINQHSINRENLEKYQAKYLGQSGEETFLTELLPLPSPGKSIWSYDNLFPQYTSRKEYEESLRPSRIMLLKNLLREFKPDVAVCYGKSDWSYYKDIFPGTSWNIEPPFEIGKWREIHVFLTPHFVPYQMGNNRIDHLCKLIAKTSEDPQNVN